MHTNKLKAKHHLQEAARGWRVVERMESTHVQAAANP
jgi:hypothetical protein